MAQKHRTLHAPRWEDLAARVAPVAVLALAALLRFWALGATEFKYDEARVANLAAHWVDTGALPLRGMGSSAGIDNPPLAVYLIGLPALLSRDPLVASGFVALLNVVAVWGCYELGRRYWGRGVGLLAALLLAASPWAIFYSRKVWAQNLLLPFVTLYVALLYAWLIDGRRWSLCAAIFVLALLTQVHLAALALAPLFALVLLAAAIQQLRRRAARGADGTRTLWAPLGIGVALGLLTYVPYLVGDAQSGWANVRALAGSLRAPAQTRWEAVRYATLNVGGRQIHALAGPERYREFLASILDLAYWPDRIEEALVALSALYLAYRAWRSRRSGSDLARYGLLTLWLVTPVLFFLRFRTPVYPHYLIPLYPAPYLALAVATRDLARATGAWAIGRRAKWRGASYALGGLLLGGLVAWQSYLSLSIHAYVDRHHTPGGMGTPVRILRQAARTMERYAKAWENPQTVVICRGDDPRWDECPAVFGYMTGRSLDARFVDGRASLLFPDSAADTLVMVAADGGAREQMTAAADIARYAQRLPGEDVPLREDVGAYRFYRLPASASPRPAVRPEGSPTRLANGVELLGYELSGCLAPGESARLALQWRVVSPPADPPAPGYSFANHVLAADGQRVGQGDGPGYRVELWRAGDTLVSWFDLTLGEDVPPPPYRLRTGMYVYTPPDQFLTIPVVDAQGQPVADATDWPLHIKTGSCIMSKSVVQ